MGIQPRRLAISNITYIRIPVDMSSAEAQGGLRGGSR